MDNSLYFPYIMIYLAYIYTITIIMYIFIILINAINFLVTRYNELYYI